MKVVIADGFEFRFSDALDAYVFDEKDSTKPTFHGAPMKGVDIVAEFEDAYVYVELKDYDELQLMTWQEPSTTMSARRDRKALSGSRIT